MDSDKYIIMTICLTGIAIIVYLGYRSEQSIIKCEAAGGTYVHAKCLSTKEIKL
jgi:hypothetical protein